MVYGDVKFAINGKVVVVEECSNEPISICRAYVIANRNSTVYQGGILLINSVANRC